MELHNPAAPLLDDTEQGERRFSVIVVGQSVGDIGSVRQAFPTNCDVEDLTLSDADLMHPDRVLDGTEWRYKIRDADLIVMVFDCAGERIPVLGSYGKIQPLWDMATAPKAKGGATCPSCSWALASARHRRNRSMRTRCAPSRLASARRSLPS